MSTIKTASKSSAVLSALRAGEKLTAAQIGARFGVKNPTATISALRQEGYCIYGNAATLADGRKTTKYVFGIPSRNMMKAAMLAKSMGLADFRI